MEQVYLRTGLKKDLWACSFTNLAPVLRVCLSSSRVLLALLVAALMWVSQLVSEVSVTPRHRTDSLSRSFWSMA